MAMNTSTAPMASRSSPDKNPSVANLKVRELYWSLGIFQNTSSASRGQKSSFATVITKFRRTFAPKNTFPIDYNSPMAQRAASELLKRHENFFCDSPDAAAGGWPTFPKDKDVFVASSPMASCHFCFLKP
jgi:hypothetical protein